MLRKNISPVPTGQSTAMIINVFPTNVVLDVKLVAFYDLRLLHDYGGPLFNLKHAKLKQRIFVDIGNNLIPSRDEHDKLRTGTVVRLMCVFTSKSKVKKKKQ